MPYLIDGHNLIGQLPDVSLSDPDDEEKLIAILAAFAGRERKDVTVIFDPAPHEVVGRLNTRERRGRVSIEWAAAGRKADDVLREHIGAARDRKGLIVVTGDAAVARYAKVNGLRVVPSRDFVRQLGGDKRKSASDKLPADVGSVDEWLAVFKEPPSKEKPIQPVRVSPEEERKRRRMEQLNRQTKGKRPLF